MRKSRSLNNEKTGNSQNKFQIEQLIRKEDTRAAIIFIRNDCSVRHLIFRVNEIKVTHTRTHMTFE